MKIDLCSYSSFFRYLAVVPLTAFGLLTILASTSEDEKYTVGGSVSGLAGLGLVLQNNGGDDLAVFANGTFTFANALADGNAYNITVLMQPSSPAQTCSVTNGSGTISGADVSTVSITCINKLTVGGTVSGLVGSGLVLQNNGGDDLAISGNGVFTFATALAGGSLYDVTVSSQPTSPPQTCAVTNGSGTLGGANVTNVAVNCPRTLVFEANDGMTGEELWKSDGTDTGTVRVKDINGLGGSSPVGFTVLNGEVYFRADDGMTGGELWKSDGTDTGTVQVKDIVTGLTSSVPIPQEFAVFNGALYFRANDGTGDEPWKSDGTEIGTVQLKDINMGAGGSDPFGFTVLNGSLYFRADDGMTGGELWTTDGTPGGTVMVKDINPGSGNSIPSSSEFAVFNGELYFTANDNSSPAKGEELWKSDGTAVGTVMVKDINPGANPSDVSKLTVANGMLYFRANDGTTTHGFELWKSDGTAVGTVMVKDINPGPGNSIPSSSEFAVFNGKLYFTANDASGKGEELWESDGTPGGTVMVKDINPSGSSSPSELTVANGMLYFRARDGVNGAELWKSDGTAVGTVMVKDINMGATGSDPSDLTAANGVLYFSANDGVNGLEFWTSDGTAAGTVRVKDINAGAGSGSDPFGFTVF